MSANLVGALILAVPALAVAWVLLWRRQRPVFMFAVAMILLGVGYLWATGAAGDIGRRWVPSLVSAPVVVPVR